MGYECRYGGGSVLRIGFWDMLIFRGWEDEDDSEMEEGWGGRESGVVS